MLSDAYYLSRELPLRYFSRFYNNVLYYQKLSIASSKVHFYANHFFDELLLVSSAFKLFHNYFYTFIFLYLLFIFYILKRITQPILKDRKAFRWSLFFRSLLFFQQKKGKLIFFSTSVIIPHRISLRHSILKIVRNSF